MMGYGRRVWVPLVVGKVMEERTHGTQELLNVVMVRMARAPREQLHCITNLLTALSALGPLGPPRKSATSEQTSERHD